MQQKVATSMSKMQIFASECYSVESVLPMMFQTINNRQPDWWVWEYMPVKIADGYAFGVDCSASLFAGMFSPHQIIKPGKDTVDLQCDIWWLGAYETDYPPDYTPYFTGVGWAVQMAILDDSINYNQIFAPSTQRIIDLVMEEWPTHPMGNPQVAAVDAQGNIDWQYDFPIGKIGEYGVEQDIAPLVRPHLKEQWAVGYQSLKVASNADWPVAKRYPFYPFQLYKTPIRMVVKKKDLLTTDPTCSFKNFTGTNETASGVGFQIFRLNDATCDGVFQQGVFGTDDESSGPFDLISMAREGFAYGAPPVFIGMELRIL